MKNFIAYRNTVLLWMVASTIHKMWIQHSDSSKKNFKKVQLWDPPLPKYEKHRKLIWCYHFVMFITYNQLMWVFKVLFGYDCTPNKSVQPHSGSTNPNCTGHTHRHTHRLFMKTPTLSVQREKQKKLLLLDFLSIPIEFIFFFNSREFQGKF